MHNTGQCHCGAVTFTVDGEPLRMAQCHCNACRRMSGTGHATWAFFNTDQVTVTGDTKTYSSPTDSGSVKSRTFCPDCGSPLFTANSRTPERMGVAAGAFDESDWFRPQLIVYPWEMPVWDMADDTIPRQERPQQ